MKYDDLINYNPMTGDLTWNVDTPRMKKGERAGGIVRIGKRDYIRVTINNEIITGHRLAWILITGTEPLPKDKIKFLDGDSTNIKADNLRYGRGTLSSFLESVSFQIEVKQDSTRENEVYNSELKRYELVNPPAQYEVFSVQGDIKKWRGRYDTKGKAEAAILFAINDNKPMSFNYSNNTVDIKIGDDNTKYSVENRREAVALIQAVLIDLSVNKS